MANIFKDTSKVSSLASIEVSNRGTNTTLGDNSVIDDFVKIKHVGGAGTLVTSELDPYSIYVGTPARKIGTRK